MYSPEGILYDTAGIRKLLCIFDTDAPSVEMIAVPVVFTIIVLLLSGGIVATLMLLFKKKKAQKSLTVNIDNLQVSSTDNGLTNIEEELVKV